MAPYQNNQKEAGSINVGSINRVCGNNREPDVITSLDQLSSAIEELGEALSSLIKKLEPVLRPTPETQCPDRVGRTGSCALSRVIIDKAERTESMIRIINETAALLEI